MDLGHQHDPPDDHGAPAEHDAPQVTPFVVARFWAGLIVGCALLLLATLVALALVPTLLGLTSATVVGSGSMSPALRVGDVVVLEPVRDRGRGLQPPSVVLVERPDGARPLLHRITGPAPTAGGYTTRGDANTDDDADPAAYADVRGVGRVVVPVIGIPLVWLDEGRLGAVALLIAALTATAMLARYGWSERHDPWHRGLDTLADPEEPQPADPVMVPHHRPRDLTATTAAALRPGPRHTTQRTRLPHPPGPPRWPTLHQPRTITTALTIIILAAAAPAALPLADAAYTGTTTNPANQLTADTLAPPTNVTATTTCTPGSAAVPTFITSRTDTDEIRGSLTLTIPGSVQAGDVLLAQVTARDGGTITQPAGWDQLDQSTASGTTPVQLSQRVATATDAGKSRTWTSPGTIAVGGLVVMRGAAPATSAGVIARSQDGTTSVAPGQNAGSLPATLLTFHVAFNVPSMTKPPTMTQRYADDFFGDIPFRAYTEDLTATGPTGDRTATLNGAGPTVGQSVVLTSSGPTPSAASVDLAWTATTSTYATGYEVRRDTGAWSTVPGGSTATTSTDTTPGTGPRTYSVRSRAGGWSSAPATSPSITPTCP